MGECKTTSDRITFTTFDEAKKCIEENQGKIGKPWVMAYYPYAAVGNNVALDGYHVDRFDDCFEGAKFDSWVLGNNEAYARLCAQKLLTYA